MATTQSEEIKTIQDQIEVPGYLKVSKIVVWAVYIFILIGIVALLLRVILLAFSANPDAGFANFVYNISSDYLQPFRGIFPPRDVGETGYLDVSAMFAIVVYMFLAWGASSLVNFVQGKIDLTKAEHRARLEEIEAIKRRRAAQKSANKSQTQTKTPKAS